jgi:hypothetical protein
VKSGFNPNFTQKFSFRNTVDEFYLNHLQSNMMIAEVYLLLGKKNQPEKIGEA